jgi:hypothetical protein
VAKRFVVVNPDRKMGVGGAEFKCRKCYRVYDTFDEGRDCAIADWKALGRDALAIEEV